MELKLHDVMGVDWIHPAQDTGQKRGLIRRKIKHGEFMTLTNADEQCSLPWSQLPRQ
jgi:hypothetical protein